MTNDAVVLDIELDTSAVTKDLNAMRTEMQKIATMNTNGSPALMRMQKQAQNLMQAMDLTSQKQEKLLKAPWTRNAKEMDKWQDKLALHEKTFKDYLFGSMGGKGIQGASEIYKAVFDNMGKFRKDFVGGSNETTDDLQNRIQRLASVAELMEGRTNSGELLRTLNYMIGAQEHLNEAELQRKDLDDNRAEVEDKITKSFEYQTTELQKQQQILRGSNIQHKTQTEIDKENNTDEVSSKAYTDLNSRLAGMSKAGSSIMQMSNLMKTLGEYTGNTSGALASLSSAFSSIAGGVGLCIAVLSPLIKLFKEGYETGMKLAKSLPSAFMKTASAIGTVTRKMNDLNKGFINAIKSGIGKLSEMTKRASEDTSTFGGKLKQLGKLLLQYGLGMRSLLYLYRKVRAQVIEGFKEMAQQVPSVNEAFSSVQTNLNGLRANVAAAFQPLITVVVPIINTLINALNNACAAIANFFATLTGQSFVYKAIGVQTDFAESLDKTGSSAGSAKKQLDKFTTGIDELNVISADDSSSGGGGSSATATFEEMASTTSKLAELLKTGWLTGDLFDFGKELGDRLASALANIDWAKVKAAGRKFGKALATLLNGFISGEFNGESVARLLGETLSEGLNTLTETIKSFFENLDAVALAKSLTEFIDGAIAKIDWPTIKVTMNTIANRIVQFFTELFKHPTTIGMLGLTIGEFLNTAMQNLIFVAKNFPYESAGASIGLGLRKMFENGITGQQIGEFIATTLNGAMTTGIEILKQLLASDTNLGVEFANAVNEITSTFSVEKFKTFSEKLGALMHDIVYDAITGINTADLLDTLWGVVSGILDGVSTFITGDGESKQSIGDALVTKINEAIEWSKNNFGPVRDKVKEFGGKLHDEIYKLFDKEEGIDWKGLGEQFGEAFITILEFAKTVLGNEEDVAKIANAISDFLVGAFETVANNAETINSIISAINTVLEKIANDETFWNTLASAMQSIDWDTLIKVGVNFEAMKKAIEVEMTKAKIADAFTLNDEESQKMSDSWNGFFKELFGEETVAQVETSADDIKTKANSVFENLGGPEKVEMVKKGFAEVFGTGIPQGADEGITTAKSEVETKASEIPDAVEKGITSNKSTATDAAKSLGTETGENIQTGVEESVTTPSAETVYATSLMLQELALMNVTQAFDTGKQIAKSILDGLNTGIAVYKETSLTTFSSWIKELLNKITVGTFDMPVLNIAKFKYIAKQCVTGLQDGITENKKALLTTVQNWVTEIITKITVGSIDMPVLNNAKFDYIAGQCLDGFVAGVIRCTSAVIEAVVLLAKEIVAKFTEPGGAYGGASDEAGSFFHYGVLVVQGFINGVNDKKQALIDTMRELGNAANEAFHESDLDYGSPSKMMRKYGVWTIEGYNEGVESKLGSITDMMDKVASRIAIPSIVTGQSIPAGLSYSADRTSAAIGASTASIVDSGYLGNAEVIAAIQTLTQVVQGLNLNISLDSKKIENGVRNVQQRRGASIATGGVINYA